ncbi:MAG TPA: YihY/virulence factor BrkB family protein [Gemmatimonadaceae bacterium]|nr:YihY/virulence factor BrkB family protein [Gemmatimonadaceae bacterium]
MVIKRFRVGPLLKKVVREVGADNIGTLAASAAYNFFFSLFPLLLFLTPLLSLIGNKQQLVGWLMSQLTSTLPPQDVPAVRQILEGVVFAKNAPGLVSVGIVLAAWSASNIFGTLMGALNTAYDVHETRSWLKQQIIRLTAFVIGGVIMIVSTVIFLNGEGVASWVGGILHLGPAFVLVWKIVQFPIAICGLVALAFLTFYALPNVRQHKGQVFVAALITALLWIAATLLFRLYVQHFPPNPAYGLIGAIIIMLTWMYYTMYVVLIGGELASELHHGTGAIAPDKGAVYLGRIVSGNGPGSASIERDG